MDLTLEAGGEKLAVTAVGPNPPTVLHLHGLGETASRHSIRYLLDPLSAHECGGLTFDFSGNGDSTGEYLRGTLRRRLAETLAVGRLLGPDPVLMGSSMGAHLAACAVPVLQPRALILFAPAAYRADAVHVPFSRYRAHAPDSETAVRPGDYADSPAYRGMESFSGDLLIVAGTEDEVVPAAVVDGYRRHASRARSTTVIQLDGCNHFVHRWLPEHDEARSEMAAAVLRITSL
jgi:pimeloyl-ACP methyl ester carboxylesterase